MKIRPFDRESALHSRKIVKEWRAGEETVKPGETRPSETVIQFEIRHSKERKAFTASVTPVEHAECFTQWCSDNPGIRIMSEPVGRYSDKALLDFADRAYARLVEVADDPRVAVYLDQIPGVRVAEAVPA